MTILLLLCVGLLAAAGLLLRRRRALSEIVDAAIREQLAYEAAHETRQTTRMHETHRDHRLRLAPLKDGGQRPLAHYDPDQRQLAVELKVRHACKQARRVVPRDLSAAVKIRLGEL